VKFAFSTGNGSNARHVPFHAGLAGRVRFFRKTRRSKALTIWPAEIFGADKDIGSIAQGKLANLFISSGDPLDLRSQITEIFIKVARCRTTIGITGCMTSIKRVRYRRRLRLEVVARR